MDSIGRVDSANRYNGAHDRRRTKAKPNRADDVFEYRSNTRQKYISHFPGLPLPGIGPTHSAAAASRIALTGPQGLETLYIDADTVDAISQERLLDMARDKTQRGWPFLVAGIKAEPNATRPRHFFAAHTLETWGQHKITNPLTQLPTNDVHYWVTHSPYSRKFSYVGAYSDVHPANTGPANPTGRVLSAMFNAHRESPVWLLLTAALYQAGTKPLHSNPLLAGQLAARVLEGKTPAERSTLYEEAIGHAISLGLHAAFNRLRADLVRGPGESSGHEKVKELALAIQTGNGDVVGELAKQMDINQPITPEVHPGITQHPTPLMLAAQVGDFPITRSLLRLGAKITPRDDWGRTAMEYADRNDIRKLLQNAESPLTPRQKTPRTPRTSW